MKKGEMLGKMLVIATNAHAGQYDKGATEKDFARMAKYHQFYLELKDIRENS